MRDFPDFGGGLLKVEEGAPAARAADVLRLGDAGPRRLEDAKGQGIALLQRDVRSVHPKAVPQAVDHGATEVGGCMKGQAIDVQVGPCAPEDHRGNASCGVQCKDRGPQIDHGMDVFSLHDPHEVRAHVS